MKPRNKIQPLPFVLPALFVYILTVIIPILWSMGYSLFSWNGIGDMKFIGLENYVRMFQDETESSQPLPEAPSQSSSHS